MLMGGLIEEYWSDNVEVFILQCDAYFNIGITSNWVKRLNTIQASDLKSRDAQVILRRKYNFRWQAELVEQVLKMRIVNLLSEDLAGWYTGISGKKIIQLYEQVYTKLAPDFELYLHVHHLGNFRMNYYRNIADLHWGKEEGPVK